jgi:2-amino-4-hydroxy-6-hydroxymethyldihydropteridine diphosphokinase
MSLAYLSLGSNVDRERMMPEAVRLLAEHGRLVAASPVYETPAVGNLGDPSYFNAAVILETPLSPAELKAQVLQPIERRLGRQRTADPNAPRTIDVDIALFDAEVLTLGKRRIPDPEILLYPHIAAPLADVAPDTVHPETGETLAQIAARVIACSAQRLVRRDDVVLWSDSEG